MTTVAAEIGSSASSYEIFGKLAKGGMAEIFLARAATAAGVARFVVLKRVLQEKASDLQFLRMFLDEARLAAQLQHPNIAQVYDVGRLGDSYFFTMEYVHGVTLRDLLQAVQQPVPMPAVLAIAAGTAAGLHHAHERIGVDGRPLGIVHRDVSPSNLMVSFEGHVKVVDFGIAKATTRTQETHSGTVRGKISYLSPEQAVGGVVDRRSDVFSLGIVMWEMLTGLRLYKRESDYASMAAVVEEPVPPLPPDCPPGLVLLVMRALAKRPEDRFQTAQQMLESIEQVAAQLGTPLSSAALSRFVRDVFGHRPEPWAGMPQSSTRNIVTVNAEPLPQELIIPPRGEIDRQLASVHDFTTSLPAHEVDPIELRPTIALPLPDSGPLPPHLLPADDKQPRRGLSPLWIGAISFALAIALVLIARVYLRKPKATPGVVVQDAGSVAIADIDAALDVPVRQTVPTDAPVADIAVPPDAAVREPKRPSAGTTSGTSGTSGSGTSGTSSTSGTSGNSGNTDRQRPSKPKQPVQEGDDGQLKGDWRVFAQCADPKTSKSPSTCVEVACRLHEASKARKWIKKVPANKRAGIIAVCKLDGIELEASKLPECEKNPSRCQF